MFSKQSFITICVVILAALLITGCQPTTPTPVAVTGVTLDQATMALAAEGAAGTLVATVAPATANNQSVTWSSSVPEVATVVDGVVTPLTEGTTTITVTTVDGGFTATCEFTVALAGTGVAVTGVTLDQATMALAAEGAAGTLVATVAPATATNQSVTWSSSVPAVATVVDGVVTPLTEGTTTITVTTVEGSFTDTCEVTMTTVLETLPITLGPAPVLLGLAGNFVILAKTGISTTGSTAVVGNMGLSQAAATYITGFGLIMDSTNVFATSSLVTGKVYAADYAPPTPANMTTAVSDMQTAFTDAAGRSLPDFTELYAGDISGQTLVPGLYKWDTGVLITSAGVTLSGGANDVWIFQMVQDLTVNNSAMVTLSGGAQAKNIFWQVSAQATLGPAADFKGIILSQTLISLNTGAMMNGRALAQTAVTLKATTITKPN